MEFLPNRRARRTSLTTTSNRNLAVLFSAALLLAVPVRAGAAQNDCGQPLSTGTSPTASDALFVLNTAVGLQTCDACVCDTDASGAVTAADALRTLNVAVGTISDLACELCSPPIELECEREEYPCSLSEADPQALSKIETIFIELWDIRDAGTMDDVRNYLAGHPDVIDAGGHGRFARFRIAGAPPAIFDDVTVVHPAVPALTATRAATPRQPREVVGKDSSGDGKIDNRDIKRAVVLAPFEWEFAPFDESPDLAARLETLDAYTDNVVFKSNPSPESANITLEDWLGLGNFDVIVISTHGSRECEADCSVWISSGVLWDTQNPPQFSTKGAYLESNYDDENLESRTTTSVTLSLDFFRFYYGGTLSNRLVTFSACETGNFEGRELATAMGGSNFVMSGWTEVVPADAAFATALAFYEELSKGLNTTEAFDIVSGLGLFPVLNSDGILTYFDRFSPSDEDVRIIELPTLIHDGDTMSDGANLAQLVVGTIGDGGADTLELTLQVDGVTEQSKSDFEIRYRVDDRDVPGTYRLDSATLVSGYEYRYEVVHELALGFPLIPGDLPIEVIVDLPEGGDSRFSVNAKLASCSFSVSLSGDRAADFDGPAQFEIRQDGALGITLRNRARINQDFLNAAQASFTTAPAMPMMPGTYNVETANVSFLGDGYTGVFSPNEPSATCPGCGGSVTITHYGEETLAGNATITLVAPDPFPPDPVQPTVLMDVEFLAAVGSQFDGSSPYVRCAIEYED